MMDERDFEPTMPPTEREALVRVGDRLEHDRPAPRPSFRGDLRRHLLGSRRGATAPVAAAVRWRLWTASYVGLGVLCLVVAGVGLAGAGPFAT